MSRRNSQAGKARRRAERQEQRARAEEIAALTAGVPVIEGDPEFLALFADAPSGAALKHPRVLEVELTRDYFPEDDKGPAAVSWSAEWGLRDDDMGIGDSSAELQQLVDHVIDSARQWFGLYDLTIEWNLSGDAPPGKTVQDMVAETGVILPGTVPPDATACAS